MLLGVPSRSPYQAARRQVPLEVEKELQVMVREARTHRKMKHVLGSETGEQCSGQGLVVGGCDEPLGTNPGRY